LPTQTYWTAELLSAFTVNEVPFVIVTVGALVPAWDFA
jgi:hypothetical protein